MDLILLYGGNSLESDISEVTYKKINSLLKNSCFNLHGVYLNHEGEFFLNNKKGYFYHKQENNYFKIGFKKIYFDYVLPLVHGKGSEDGTIKAYFDTLNIPCLSSSILSSALLQDKIIFKELLSFLNIRQTKYTFFSYEEYMDLNFNLSEKIKELSFPLIVKPNSLGSSLGVKKVLNLEELIFALDKAFEFDEKVLIEEAILNLKEVNIALLGNRMFQIESELETVSNKDDVLTYFDKYLQSKDKTTRIIPADIDLLIKEEIISTSKKVFKYFDCFGIVRFDYLLDQKTNKLYLNELNTIPGSLAYYLFEHKNINCEQLILKFIEFYKKRRKTQLRLLNNYHEGDKKQLLSKE